jgi:glyoxylase-like metal-dependent hydrolase (beta-lactamase superfamily II)
LGKHSIEQVILTHTHSDHASLLPTLREKYHPKVYAQSAFIGADIVVRDGQTLKCGDRYFEVIRCPGHSDDSICLFCPTDGVLFVGDASVVIRTTDDTYEHGFVAALERLCRLDVRTIYFGHGSPLIDGASQVLHESLRNVHLARKNVI